MTSVASTNPIRLFADAQSAAVAGDPHELPEALGDCPPELTAKLRSYLAGYEAGALAAFTIAERPIEPPLPVVDADGLGELLGVSGATVRRFRSAGKLPQTLELEGEMRWARSVILDWIDAGCPDKAKWEQSRQLDNSPRRRRRPSRKDR